MLLWKINYCIQYEGTERSTIASSSFIIIRPVISNILPEFLCCFLNTSSILGMLKNAAVGTGIQVIPQSVMGEIQLDIPSIEVQRLVVEMDQFGTDRFGCTVLLAGVCR